MSFYDNCEFYELYVKDKITMVTVDLSFVNSASIKRFPVCATLQIKFNSPYENGLPPNEDFQIVTQIEDKIIVFLENKITKLASKIKRFFKQKSKKSESIVYVGRYFYDGEVYFTFYCYEDYNFDQFAKKLMVEFENYEYQASCEIDKEWDFYNDFLYPSELEFQLISDRNLIDRLEKLGDDPEIARDISYWLYFKDVESRQKCLTELLENDYKFEQNHEGAEEEYSRGFVVNKESLLNLDTANAHSTFLYEMAEKYNGCYDGWETPIMKKN